MTTAELPGSPSASGTMRIDRLQAEIERGYATHARMDAKASTLMSFAGAGFSVSAAIFGAVGFNQESSSHKAALYSGWVGVFLLAVATALLLIAIMPKRYLIDGQLWNTRAVGLSGKPTAGELLVRIDQEIEGHDDPANRLAVICVAARNAVDQKSATIHLATILLLLALVSFGSSAFVYSFLHA